MLAAAATAGVLAARQDPAEREAAEFLAGIRTPPPRRATLCKTPSARPPTRLATLRPPTSFDEAARLVVLRNDEDLAKLVAALRLRGVKLRAVLPAQVRRMLNLGGSAQTVAAGGETGSHPNTPGQLATAPTDNTVRVYNPQYLATATAPAGSAGQGASYLDLSDAWSAAQARAARAVQSGDLPADLRPIVRRFFQPPSEP